MAHSQQVDTHHHQSFVLSYLRAKWKVACELVIIQNSYYYIPFILSLFSLVLQADIPGVL